jgi:hypothetical protein
MTTGSERTDMARDRNIRELSDIEFTGSLSEAFKAYGDTGEDLTSRWAFELEVGAADAEAAMACLKGHPLLLGLDVRWRARQVAKRLKRSQELVDGLGHELSRFHRDYTKHFIP